MTIGVAGGYCSGKDTVAGLLAAKGWPVIDVDGLGHRALELRKREVIERFGSGIVGEDGGIDRRRLGAAVFGNSRALSDLEDLLHPAMVEMVDERVSRHGGRCVINAAILFRMGLHSRCDLVLCVRAPLLTRFLRARRRDRARWREFRRVLRAQRGICPKNGALGVDTHIVCNAGSMRVLERRITVLLARHDRPLGPPER